MTAETPRTVADALADHDAHAETAKAVAADSTGRYETSDTAADLALAQVHATLAAGYAAEAQARALLAVHGRTSDAQVRSFEGSTHQ